MFLEHVLWKDPEERPKVRDAMRRIVKGFEEEARELLIQSQELREYAERRWESDELRSARWSRPTPRSPTSWSASTICLRDAAEGGRTIAGVEAMRAQVSEIQQAMLRRTLGA